MTIRRTHGNLVLGDAPVSIATLELEREGYTVLRGLLGADEIELLSREIAAVFDTCEEPDPQFRHEMLNRSAACQAVVAQPVILATIEPLLGEDCHVIANTAWRNPTNFGGQGWHCDAGPHVPRRDGVPWDDRIPYPVFAIAAHLLLRDCPRASGPTAVVPGSHRSGRLPPPERNEDPDLTYDGRPPAVLEGRAGDVLLFASDAWHRGLPAEPAGTGRFFLQVHYARRDIAQRLRPTACSHQLSPEALARIASPRERLLLGLHEKHFYDG
jgi:ectoine hydroxylase-related dioxygenase (phytanoyl-CoA dioxygenase family)